MSKTKIIIIVIVAVVIIGAGVAFLMMGKKQDNSETTTTVKSGLGNLDLGSIFGGIASLGNTPKKDPTKPIPDAVWLAATAGRAAPADAITQAQIGASH